MKLFRVVRVTGAYTQAPRPIMITLRQICDQNEVGENFVQRLIDREVLRPVYIDGRAFFTPASELRLHVILKALELGFSLNDAERLIDEQNFRDGGAYG